MSRPAPSIYTAPEPLPGVRTSYASLDSPACRHLLYALNRGLPHGFLNRARRELSIAPGPPTASGARTFNVTFHS